MKRTRIFLNIENYPPELQRFLKDVPLYDSSSSPCARVIMIERDNGYFLKEAARGTLEKEANLTRYFHNKGLSSDVILYHSNEKDYMLTERVPGEDACFFEYLENPKRLCVLLAETMNTLHGTSFDKCPVPNRMKDYFMTVEQNYSRGMFDPSIFKDTDHFGTADDFFEKLQTMKHLFKSDTLIHGDFCLPNVIFNQFRFSGLIDLGNGGVGDRHIDLFWCAWSLWYNLKTDAYTDRFFDAYGREKIDMDVLRAVYLAESFG